MRNRIVTAVKQRFSIRKLSIGAASVLLGTSLYFMGVSAPVVHAATNGETPASSETSTDSKDPVSVAGQSKYSDVDVNNAIDQYAEKNQDAVNEQEEKEKTGNKVIIRPSDKQPVTVYNTTDRKTQVENIIQKEINDGITKANQNWDKIQEYKKNHNDQQILNGTESDYFENQGLSIDDEKGSEINKITVTDDKDTTKTKDVDTKAVDGETKDIGKITNIADFDGIDITHTSNMTDKEREAMKVNSDNKVIVDFQPAQYPDKKIDKEITVTYDNLNNSYYLENINNKTNRIKISRIDRTFSSIEVADNPHLFYGGWRGNKYDYYDPCNGPQLIIYNDPSDGFFYNNIKQVSVKDIYYDDEGNPIKIGDNKTGDKKTGDKNTAWIFVTSLNSNGGGNIEKVRAQGPNNSPVNAEKIAGSTVTVTHHNDGWWYSDNNNNFGTDPDWDNNDENNLFGFVGTVAFQYYPGMTLQYRADDSQWGSHWACMQTQVVSSLYTPVIIYDHIKDGYSRSDDVNMTVHYVMDDGSKASSDSKQTASFTESGIQDSVTGKITWTPAASGIQDNVTGKITWTPATSQTFEDVTTPAITGYTPDNDKVAGSTVKFGDKDIEVTVTYSPDKQHMTITYIDDTTGKTLHTDNPEGVSDQDAKYTTKHTIEQFEDQHYKLISDSTNGKDLIFDHDDNVNQTYEVHFVHDTQKVNRKDTVTETINYKFEDGTTAQPTVTQTENFSEDGNKDLVTGKTTWDEATPQTFEDVTTPAITGYTPNKDKVAGSTVKFGDKDIEVTVTYHNNTQTAKITYIDDTEKKTLGSDKQTGKFDHEIKFEHDPAEVIKGLEEKGYKLVSDNFKPGIKYQDDNKLNIFEVHLVHTYEPVETSQTITETVHYIDANGNPVAPDHVAKVVIEVTGTRDKVTDSITWNTPSTGHFDEVISPEVPNMTPDKKLIPGRDVQYGDSDITENVVYTPDNPTSKTPKKPHKPDNPTSKTPKKPHKPNSPTSKISKKPHKLGNPTSKTPENKQSGTIVKTTIPEKPIDSRTVDNHASAKSAAKRELPQTGATTNTGIWTGLVSMIASLGLLGASKKRKKN